MDKAEVIECLNLCDIQKSLFDALKSLPKIVSLLCENNITQLQRIYFGSYFCGNYFCNMDMGQIDAIVHYSRLNKISLTIVIPIVSESLLHKTKERFSQIICKHGSYIDEVTVNDIGMQNYIINNYSLKLNIGRMLIKWSRDCRYQNLCNQIIVPDLNIPQHLKGRVNSVEYDLIRDTINFVNYPESIIPSIHFPYVYLTVGQICEYASIPYALSKKFRPNCICNQECSKVYITYTNQYGNYERIGRAILYKSNFMHLLNAKSYRKIYFPFDYIKEILNESIGSIK